MERKTLILSAPVLGITCGVIAWLLYPPIFEIVASPVSDMVTTFDREVLQYRLFAGAAFCLLGVLVPITAGMIGGFRADRHFGIMLGWVAVVAALLVLLTAWWLHHELVGIAKIASSFAAEDPSIPNSMRYEMVPLYRLATVPAIVLVVAGVMGWFLELIRCPKTANGQQGGRGDGDKPPN